MFAALTPPRGHVGRELSRPDASSAQWLRSLGVLLVLFTLTACADEQEPDPTSPAASERSEVAVAQSGPLDPEQYLNIESVFARIWNQVPAFAGFWYDDRGRLVIAVTDEDRGPEVQAFLENLFGGDYLYDSEGSRVPVRITEVAYDFRTMIDWKLRARKLFGIPGFFLLDYAEDRNEIYAEVEESSQTEGLAEALSGIGIPEEAFAVGTGVLPVRTTTINDAVRPLVGGLEIEAEHECTLGFNAISGALEGFVTNAHCTPNPGQVDGVDAYQPSSANQDALIGIEDADPQPQDCSGTPCRYADAAFFRFSADSISWDRAVANIVESTSCTVDNSAHDKTIDESDPGEIYLVTRTDDSQPAIGEYVNQLGKTTGQTKAPVDQTDVDLFSSFSDILWLDQTISRCEDCIGITKISDSGDSGGPVYSFSDGDFPCGSIVRLHGIRWGTNPDDPDTRIDDSQVEVWWSPIQNVEQDLGSLDIEHN